MAQSGGRPNFLPGVIKDGVKRAGAKRAYKVCIIQLLMNTQFFNLHLASEATNSSLYQDAKPSLV